MGRHKKLQKDDGKPIRISNEVLRILSPKLKTRESYDSLLRRLLGLPKKNGTPQELEVFWVLPVALQVFRKPDEAKGAAVLNAVKSGKKKAERAVKVMECI